MAIWKYLPLCTLLLTGCGSDSEPSGVWSEDSQRLQVERFNGNTPIPEERYTYFDLAKDDLEVETIRHLSSLSTTEDNLMCYSDARTYDVVITDSSGIERQYYSSNRQCGRESDGKFIPLDDLEALNSLLE
jgi:hypothetical protein